MKAQYNNKMGENDDNIKYLTRFTEGYEMPDDDSDVNSAISKSIHTICSHFKGIETRDITPKIFTEADICTLVFISDPATAAISNHLYAIEEKLWDEDYSDEDPLEIKMESPKKEYEKESLFKQIYSVYRECSDTNWDSYEAEPITEKAFFEVTKFVDLLPSDFPMPDISPESTGEIAIEWYKDKKHVFVASLSGKGTISYAGLFGKFNKTHGTEYFSNAIPGLIIEHISRLFRYF